MMVHPICFVQELDAIKQRVQELEKEAEKLREVHSFGERQLMYNPLVGE